MKVLYSNVLPLNIKDEQTSILNQFIDCLQQSDTLYIATGYASKSSLIELDRLCEQYNIDNVLVTLGMYCIEGMPEGMYHQAKEINQKWIDKGIGEIRLVKNMKFHAKIYLFFKEGHPIGAITGSNNLGFLKLEASNRRQYELATFTDDNDEIEELKNLVKQVNSDNCSQNIATIENLILIRELNKALAGQEFVEKVTEDTVKIYQEHQTNCTFDIPLKVPENLNDDSMRGSNINVCYASGRKRVWWETEIVVAKPIRDLPGYPLYQKPFIAVTDDGWRFQVWTCGQNNKNLYSKDDLKIMGRWIKGRLVAAGLVSPVNNVNADTEGKGIITREMLKAYGRDTITLTKTNMTTVIDNGEELDVWMLSFLPESQKGID